MPDKIQQILTDLYELDSSLKEHEPMVIKIIEKLLKSRPEITIDEQFKQKLYQELEAKILSLKTNKQTSMPASFLTKLKKLATIPSFSYAVGLAAVIIIVVVMSSQPGAKPGGTIPVAHGLNIQNLGQSAFGSLSTAVVNSRDVSTAKGEGGGTGMASSAPMAARESGRNLSDVTIYTPEYYVYKYIGEDLSLADSLGTVYRRVKDSANSQFTRSILRDLNFNLLDLNQFSSTKLEQFSLTEDQDYGYSLYVNLTEGSVSISQNWGKWPDPYRDCRDEACSKAVQLELKDVPADDKLIAVADKFVSDYGLNLDGYAEPIIMNEWRVAYDAETARGGVAYIPDSVSIVYPLEIAGETVYEQSGYPFGLYVSVNIRYNRVDNVYNMLVNNYESSAYALEQDVSRILEVAQNGGSVYPMPRYEDYGDARKMEIKLDTPERILLKVYCYEDNQSDELIVPALKFPVVRNDESANYWQRFIIVPLVAELLRTPDDVPFPMPLLEPAAGQGIGVSTPSAGPAPDIMIDSPVELDSPPEE